MEERRKCKKFKCLEKERREEEQEKETREEKGE